MDRDWPNFLDLLPELFRSEGSDGFPARFLHAFEGIYRDFQGCLDAIPAFCDPNSELSPAFKYQSAGAESERISYLAGWLGLPVRTEIVRRVHINESDEQFALRKLTWNKEYLKEARDSFLNRSTAKGLDGMLRAWLKHYLFESDPPFLVLTDLTACHNRLNTVFQLAPASSAEESPCETYAQVGLTTVLGIGPPFFFISDLVTDPAIVELRSAEGLDAFQTAARTLLDAERPAYTSYQLRVRAHTMQLAPVGKEGVPDDVYARIGLTTLLWEEPWVFDSAC